MKPCTCLKKEKKKKKEQKKEKKEKRNKQSKNNQAKQSKERKSWCHASWPIRLARNHSPQSDEGSKTPLVKKFTYFIFEPWIKKKIKKENGNEVVYWLEMRLCMFPWISSHSWLDYHQPLLRNLIWSPSTDRKEGWTRRLAKVDFLTVRSLSAYQIQINQSKFSFDVNVSVQLSLIDQWLTIATSSWFPNLLAFAPMSLLPIFFPIKATPISSTPRSLRVSKRSVFLKFHVWF